MWIATFRLPTASLLQAMRSTGHAWSYEAWCSTVISCFQQLWLVHFDPCCFTQWFAPSAVRCRTALLLLCFFDRVDVIRVKSYMNCLFDPARVVIRVTINKLYFVPEWLVSGVVGMLWNGGGLGTGESNVSIMLLNSVLHRSYRESCKLRHLV